MEPINGREPSRPGAVCRSGMQPSTPRRRLTSMQSVWPDVRYAARGLRKQPGFAALAILALALGIGSATTMFSFIQNVLIDPYPYAHIDRLVQVELLDPSRPRNGARLYFPLPEFLDYQEQVHSFEEVIAGTHED